MTKILFGCRVHALYILVLCITAAYVIMAWRYPIAYIWATYEDLYGEWAQTYLFLLAGILSAAHAIRSRRARLFFVLLALACVYTVGEEISWGQRLWNWSTPEFFRVHNLQSETNLHNLVVGPYQSSARQVIKSAMAVGLVTFGLVYPLALARGAVAQ
jgi:hypothetical protein